MLGVLCGRPKSWIFAAALSHFGGGVHHHRISVNPVSLIRVNSICDERKRVHSSSCRIGSSIGVGAASIWHAILPSGNDCRNLKPGFHYEHKGEGSWNVSSDVRPARWLHGSDSAWLLFGVCSCLAPLDRCNGIHEQPQPPTPIHVLASSTITSNNHNEGCNLGLGLGSGGGDAEQKKVEVKNRSSVDYRVTGVLADGRCLFRALAHGECLRCGEEAPDEARQRALADDLRARVVDELLKRRKESEWFIEGDFDAHVKRIQDPNEWGGEPELIMASHVLQIPISVFIMERSSRDFKNITTYGQEYGKSKNPIKLLFHVYGHYDLLETLSDKS